MSIVLSLTADAVRIGDDMNCGITSQPTQNGTNKTSHTYNKRVQTTITVGRDTPCTCPPVILYPQHHNEVQITDSSMLRKCNRTTTSLHQFDVVVRRIMTFFKLTRMKPNSGRKKSRKNIVTYPIKCMLKHQT